MSNVMLFGVLRMPIDCWRNDEIDKVQRHSTYVFAADKIENAIDNLKLIRTSCKDKELHDKINKVIEDLEF